MKPENNSTATEIAREFVEFHKTTLRDWEPTLMDDEEKLILIYNQIILGVYGECRETGFGDEIEIEIPGRETVSGNPRLFTFNPAPASMEGF